MNAATNRPSAGKPARGEEAGRTVNGAAAVLFVPPDEIAQAVETLAVHDAQRRPLESRHPLALRRPQAPTPPEPRWDQAGAPPDCAMHALDRWLVRLVDANPALRLRVGNPDELRRSDERRVGKEWCSKD